jgi:hypothetical protein
MEAITPADLKAIVTHVLDKDSSKKFNSVIDIGKFLWEVVHRIIETSKSAALTLQQKEDIVVKISADVINFLEERGSVTIELAEKARNLLKTTDVFLDILLGIYSFVTVNKIVQNVSKENCFKTVFSILSCFSSKAVQPVQKTSIVEIVEKNKNNAAGTGLVIEDVKVEASVEEKVEASVEEKVEASVEEKVEAHVEEKVEASVEEKVEATVEEKVEATVEEKVEAPAETKTEDEIFIPDLEAQINTIQEEDDSSTVAVQGDV